MAQLILSYMTLSHPSFFRETMGHFKREKGGQNQIKQTIFLDTCNGEGS